MITDSINDVSVSFILLDKHVPKKNKKKKTKYTNPKSWIGWRANLTSKAHKST